MARPKKISDEKLICDVQAYLNDVRANNGIPNLIRFAQRNGMTRQAIFARTKKNPALFDAIKAILEEKEAVLEEGALTGRFAQTMAIFSLKQIGWRDRPEEDPYGDDEEDSAGVIQIPSAELIEATNE